MDLGGAEVHAWVELVDQGMIDQHNNFMAHIDQKGTHQGPTMGGGEGNILELEGVF